MRERWWMLALGCGLLLAWSQVALGQEWTRFRGPNGSGQSEATTIPATWTEDEALWKVALPGSGNASPVLWGDRIFLISASTDDGTRYVLCLSAADGKLLWRRDYPSRVHHIHQLNTLASSTPTVDDQRVYCAWSTPEEITLLALTHGGDPVWKADLGPFASQHGFGTSPILYENSLILVNDQDSDSFVIAMDPASGKTLWKTPRRHLPEQNTCYATPCVYKPEGRPEELILCSRAQGIAGMDPRTGETRWESAVFDRRVVSSPVVVDGLVLATCGKGGGPNTFVALRPYADGNEPTIEYQIDRNGAPYVPSAVAKGNLVFLWGDGGIVTCIDASSGRVHWRERVGGNYFGSPVRVADCVYCMSNDGEAVAIAASDTFRPAGSQPAGRNQPGHAGRGRRPHAAENRIAPDRGRTEVSGPGARHGQTLNKWPADAFHSWIPKYDGDSVATT